MGVKPEGSKAFLSPMRVSAKMRAGAFGSEVMFLTALFTIKSLAVCSQNKVEDYHENVSH